MADDPRVAAGLIPVGGREVKVPDSNDDRVKAGLRPVSFQNSDKRAALAQGAVAGAQQGGMATMGAVAGATIGAPLGPPGVVGGAILGGAAGYIGGRILTDHTIGGEETVPEELRPYYAGGEIFAGGLPMAFTPLGAAKLGVTFAPTRVGNFLNGIINTAKSNPFAFIASETSGLAGSAVAGGAAENYAPGNALVRFGAEVTGGFFNPGRLFLSGTKTIKFGISKVLNSMSKSGRETEAQKLLMSMIEDSGEDPVALVAILKDPSITGLTAAQKTGSAALSVVQAKIARDNLKFGVKVKEMAEDGLNAMESQIALLRRTGDPGALRLAAASRQRQYRSMLTNLVKNAESDAVTAARAITADTPAARSEISKQAREAMEEVLSLSRQAETELWDKIPKDVTTSALPLTRSYNAAKAELLPEEPLPGNLGWVDDFMERMKSQRYSVTAGELLTARNRFLKKARDATEGANPNWDEARILGMLADGALESLSKASSRKIPPFVVDDAREFSRALNDTFTRTFAGKALGSSAGGADRLPPELLLRAALSTGEEAGALRFAELEQATRFLHRENVDPAIIESSEAAINKMQEAQERFLRLSVSDAINPLTGRVNKNKLADTLKKQETLFNRFPEARDAVQNALNTEQGLQNLERVVTRGNRIVDQQAAFSKVVKAENPVDVISKAINGANPTSEIKAIAKLAKRSGPEATAGLKASAIEYILSQSGTNFDPKNLKKAVFSPISPGKPTLAETFVANGVLDESDVERISQVIDAASNITATKKVRGDLLDKAEEMDALTDLFVSLQGAKLFSMLAAAAPGGGSSHGLLFAAKGSSFSRSLFKKMDVKSMEKVLIEASLNPNLMAALIEKPATKARAFSLGNQIHAYLLNAGFSFSTSGQFSSEDRKAMQEELP